MQRVSTFLVYGFTVEGQRVCRLSALCPGKS